MGMLFNDRFAGGKTLVEEIKNLHMINPVVLAIPRGGIQTGRAIADELHLQLDIILCKKIGHPENPELAVGSVCADGTTLQTMDVQNADPNYFDHQATRLRTWLLGRYQQLTGRSRPMDISGREVLLTDDGIATGSTVLSAIRSIRTSGAVKVVVAVPVASAEAASIITKSSDTFICPLITAEFQGVGQFYRSFGEVSDAEVRTLFQTPAVVHSNT